MNVVEMLEDQDNFYIVSEILKGGELFDRLVMQKSFSEQKAAHIISQVLLAINYMHKKNITHRDLKPENILLESTDVNDLSVKISDFGFSCFFDSDGLELALGSPLYMAPEIHQKKKYSEKVDVWSIGVITYMLVSGKNPFPGKSKEDIKRMIIYSKIDLDKPQFETCSKNVKDFIMKALDKNQKSRWSAEKLLQHPWIVENQKLNNKKIDATSQEQMLINISNFAKANKFQKMILSILIGLKTDRNDLCEIKAAFT